MFTFCVSLLNFHWYIDNWVHIKRNNIELFLKLYSFLKNNQNLLRLLQKLQALTIPSLYHLWDKFS